MTRDGQGEAFLARAIRETPTLSDVFPLMVAIINTHLATLARDHTQERPEISAMHTAYDHRRKTRRARRRT